VLANSLAWPALGRASGQAPCTEGTAAAEKAQAGFLHRVLLLLSLRPVQARQSRDGLL